jgi:hypothetical protein
LGEGFAQGEGCTQDDIIANFIISSWHNIWTEKISRSGSIQSEHQHHLVCGKPHAQSVASHNLTGSTTSGTGVVKGGTSLCSTSGIQKGAKVKCSASVRLSSDTSASITSTLRFASGRSWKSIIIRIGLLSTSTTAAPGKCSLQSLICTSIRLTSDKC